METVFYTASNYDKKMDIGKRSFTHGFYGTRAYNSWHNMKQRCLNPNNKFYYNYGGRGIGVCEKWLDFSNFIEDMGLSGAGKEIDRINNNIGYCKENCRWATRTIGNYNKKATNKTGLPRGVHVHKTKYKSSLSVGNKSYHIGIFSTITEAKAAYDEMCMEWYGFLSQEIIAVSLNTFLSFLAMCKSQACYRD